MNMLINEYAKVKKIFIFVVLSFIAIFLLRLGYEVFFTNHDIIINYGYSEYSNESYEGEGSTRVITKNVATDKISQKDTAGQDITIDQKYEKTANISAKTSDFKTDNQNLRNIIKDNDAVIQMENLTGLEGHQKLTMMIGVMPENFDGIVESIRSIGTLQSFTVNKEDKTAEFRNLLAEQETLKKTRDSYVAIKEKGGDIKELLLLEDKILETEKNLQNLGVDIGIYSTENSFCTINFTLNETEAIVKESSLKFILKCAKRSFGWTVWTCILLVILIIGFLIATFIFLILTNNIKKTIAINKTRDIENQNDENKKE